MEQLLHLQARAVSLMKAQDVHSTILIAALMVSTLVLCAFYFSFHRKALWENSGLVSYLKFAYSCFIKPHRATSDGGQQSALEGFYSTQVPSMSYQLCSSLCSTGRCLRRYSKEASSRARGSSGPYCSPVAVQTKQRRLEASKAHLGGCWWRHRVCRNEEYNQT